MHIQLNSDRNIDANEASNANVRTTMEAALSRYSEHITRVEVHLSDENAGRGGSNDKRCMMEARLEGRQPIAVTHQAASLNLAIAGATDKLARLIDSTLGRLRDQQSRSSEASASAAAPADVQRSTP